MKYSRFLPWLLVLLFALLFASTQVSTQKQTPIVQNSSPIPSVSTSASLLPEVKSVQVVRVIDGDTIEIEGGVRIRYIGLNTPETGDCFGTEATQANKQLVEGKSIRLEYDIQRLDKYGRTLAYVYVDNIFVNKKLTEDGFANVATYPPNVRYQEKFIKAEREARAVNRGLWSPEACKVTSEVINPDTSQIHSATSECLIKGNINSKKEKIYHVPGQRYYEKTQVNEGAGERWFCSEQEAEQAGWRKSKV